MRRFKVMTDNGGDAEIIEASKMILDAAGNLVFINRDQEVQLALAVGTWFRAETLPDLSTMPDSGSVS